MKFLGIVPPTTWSANSNPDPRGQRLDLQAGMAVLAVAARLLLVFVLAPGGNLDRFFVRHLGRSQIDVDAELALHLIDCDLEMRPADTGKDGVGGIQVAVHRERRVFFHKAGKGRAHFIDIDLGLRMDSAVKAGTGKTMGAILTTLSLLQRVSPVTVW